MPKHETQDEDYPPNGPDGVEWATQASKSILLMRYCYYVLKAPVDVMSLDKMWKELWAWEAQNPHLVHPKSPIGKHPSDQASDYPIVIRKMGNKMYPEEAPK